MDRSRYSCPGWSFVFRPARWEVKLELEFEVFEIELLEMFLKLLSRLIKNYVDNLRMKNVFLLVYLNSHGYMWTID